MEGGANESEKEIQREIEREREYQVRNIIIVDSCSHTGRGSLAPDTRAKLNAAPFRTDLDYLFSSPDYSASSTFLDRSSILVELAEILSFLSTVRGRGSN